MESFVQGCPRSCLRADRSHSVLVLITPAALEEKERKDVKNRRKIFFLFFPQKPTRMLKLGKLCMDMISCTRHFGLVFLQTLVEVGAELHTEEPNHLVPVHLAEGGAIHGTVCQTQGVCIKLGILHMVTDPLQNMVCCPVMGADLPVPLTCNQVLYTLDLQLSAML